MSLSDKKKVLVVDDDVTVALYLRAGIEALGHEAIACHDGLSATASFVERQPDLVLMDVLLPHRDGLQLCSAFRDLPGGTDVPILLMTGVYRKTVYKREALDTHGATDYLFKPLTLHCLWGALEQHLGPAPTAGPFTPDENGTDLARLPIAVVLAEHRRATSNGTLFLRSSEGSAALVLRDGVPIQATAWEDELASAEAYEAAGVSKAMLREVRELGGSRSPDTWGPSLVQLGHWDETTRLTFERDRARKVLDFAITLSEGRAVYVEDASGTDDVVTLEVESNALLHRAAMFGGSDEAVNAALPTASSVLKQRRVLAADSGDWSPESRSLVRELERGLSTTRFLALARLLDLDGPRLLLGLIVSGHVEALPAPSEAQPTVREVDESRFRDLSAAAALVELYRARADGELVVREGGQSLSLFLRNGEPVFQPPTPAGLVATLSRMGGLEQPLPPDTDWAAAESACLRDRTPAELLSAFVHEARSRLEAVTAQREGRIRWLPGASPEDAGALDEVSGVRMVRRAIQALSGAELRRLLPPKGCALAATTLPSPEQRARLEVLTEEEELLAWLQDPSSFSELCEARTGTSPDVLRRQVLFLMTCDLVAPAEERVLAPVDTLTPAEAEDKTPLPNSFEAMLARELTCEDPAPSGEMEVELESSGDEAELAATTTSTSTAELNELQRALARLRPTLAILRRGLEGDEPTVSVRRAPLRELFDELLSLTGRIVSEPELEEATVEP
ncbi:MAG: response regulator [Acidobacteriota bacterium]